MIVKNYWWDEIEKGETPDFTKGDPSLPQKTSEQYKKMSHKRRLSFLRRRLKERFKNIKER